MSDLQDCAGTCIVCIPDCPVQVRQREEAEKEMLERTLEELEDERIHDEVKSRPSKLIPNEEAIGADSRKYSSRYCDNTAAWAKCHFAADSERSTALDCQCSTRYVNPIHSTKKEAPVSK